MTIPDPITTAREALAYIAENFSEDVPDEVYSRADTGYDAITAALDLAEKLQAENERMNAALSVTQEEGRTEIARLEAELEKLTAERDEWKGNYERVASDGDAARSEITRLTSQLEQAEKVIAPFAKCGEVKITPVSGTEVRGLIPFVAANIMALHGMVCPY